MTAKEKVLQRYPEAFCDPLFYEGFDAIEPDAYRVYATPQKIRALGESDTESEAWENAQWHLEKSDDRKG